MADILGIADYINRAGQQGRAQFEKREIGSSIGRLLSGEGDRNAEIGAIAKLDPTTGIQANTMMGQLDDASVKRLGQQASVFTALPPDQKAAVYPSLAREAQRLGYQVPGEYRPEMDAAIDRLAQTFGGRGSETPSQQRYAEWLLAQVPAEDRDQALGVLAGTKARPPTGGYGFGTVEWGGREAPTRTNPRDGSQEVWSGQAWVPLGSQPTYSQPPAQGYGVQPLPGDQISIIEQEIGRPLTQQERGQIASGTLNLQVPVAQPVGQSPSATRVSNPGASMVGADLPPRLDYQNGGVIPGAPGIGRTPDEQAALTRQAEQEVDIRYLPIRGEIDARNAALKTQAEEDIKSSAKREVDQVERDATFELYDAAMSAAINGMEGAITGPFIGKLPALTEKGQIAEGGVAAMAPVLKQIFRVAGEGTFTDKDQEMLMNMLPTRNDLPGARKAKAAAIDQIVRAKLRQGPAPSQSNDAPPSGAIRRARNPQTGEMLELRNGQWVPAR